MRTLLLALVAPCLISGQAGAQLERSSLVARSQAIGGAFVSRADDPSSIFVNPAGMASAAPIAAYLDYDEPSGAPGSRETRLAGAAGTGPTRFGFGWYRLGGDVASQNLVAAGAALRIIEGTQGSFLSAGATVGVGSLSGRSCCGNGGSSRSNVWRPTADAGILLKPLPVISFGYAIANASNERLRTAAGEPSWTRVQRWGVSYFWEERVVVSFAEEHSGGRTTTHYGMSVKTAAPIELMAGFSAGNATGGVRWLGGGLEVALAFASGEGHSVLWTCSLEMALRRAAKEGLQ